MESKPYRAFGYIVMMNRFFKGEDMNFFPVENNRFTVGENFPYVWLYTSGSVLSRKADTGEEKLRVAGDCTIDDPWPTGEWIVSNDTDYDVCCISADTNEGKPFPIPNLEKFSLSAGQTQTLAKGTRLLLAHGSISIDGVIVSGVRPIEFASGEKTVTAVTSAYGLIFE